MTKEPCERHDIVFDCYHILRCADCGEYIQPEHERVALRAFWEKVINV